MKIIQIKNKPLRAFVSTIALLLMVAIGGTVLAVISYGVGLVTPLNDLYQPTTADIIAFGIGTMFLVVCAAAVLAVIVWGIYEGVKRLYHGPFDP